MDERRDLVDREELRREIAEQLKECHAESLSAALWRVVLTLLDAMPAVECPRGWTRDEVLAELDADPDAVCEWLHPLTGMRGPYGRYEVSRWHPEVRRYDVRVVRVVRVAPEPEWVPLTQLVGRTIHGCDKAVTCPPFFGRGEWLWQQHPDGMLRAFPEGTLNLETGQVAVRPKAAT